MFSSRGSSRPRDQTHVSCVSCTGRRILYTSATWEATWFLRNSLTMPFRAPSSFLLITQSLFPERTTHLPFLLHNYKLPQPFPRAQARSSSAEGSLRSATATVSIVRFWERKWSRRFRYVVRMSVHSRYLYMFVLGMGFPVGGSGKELTYQCRRPGFNPWVEKTPMEEGMASHSIILAWRIPWTAEPGGLQSMGLQRVGHD